MSNEAPAPEIRADLGQKIVYWLALALVIVGLLNAMPGIPTSQSENTPTNFFTPSRSPR